jgi:hypothetical protein
MEGRLACWHVGTMTAGLLALLLHCWSRHKYFYPSIYPSILPLAYHAYIYSCSRRTTSETGPLPSFAQVACAYRARTRTRTSFSFGRCDLCSCTYVPTYLIYACKPFGLTLLSGVSLYATTHDRMRAYVYVAEPRRPERMGFTPAPILPIRFGRFVSSHLSPVQFTSSQPSPAHSLPPPNTHTHIHIHILVHVLVPYQILAKPTSTAQPPKSLPGAARPSPRKREARAPTVTYPPVRSVRLD